MPLIVASASLTRTKRSSRSSTPSPTGAVARMVSRSVADSVRDVAFCGTLPEAGRKRHGVQGRTRGHKRVDGDGRNRSRVRGRLLLLAPILLALPRFGA